LLLVNWTRPISDGWVRGKLAMAMTHASFCEKWRAALRGRGLFQFSADWEAPRAIGELSRRSLLSAATLEMLFADEIVREAEVYEKHRQCVAAFNSVYAEAERLLQETENTLVAHARDFRKRLPVPTGAVISDHFSQLAESVANERKEFSNLKTKRWTEALKTYPLREEDTQNSIWVFADSGMPMELEYDAALRRLIERSEALPQTSKLIRGFDLDRRFQLRIAAILARALPRVSKMTVARLVVLTYICAQLVEVKGGVRIPGTKRLLTPTGVYQKIKGVASRPAAPTGLMPGLNLPNTAP
jgi:hypothetical protein